MQRDGSVCGRHISGGGQRRTEANIKGWIKAARQIILAFFHCLTDWVGDGHGDCYANQYLNQIKSLLVLLITGYLECSIEYINIRIWTGLYTCNVRNIFDVMILSHPLLSHLEFRKKKPKNNETKGQPASAKRHTLCHAMPFPRTGAVLPLYLYRRALSPPVLSHPHQN